MTDAAVWTKALTITGITFTAYLLAMWVAIVVWTYRDITSRTPDTDLRTLSVGLVAVFSLPGLLIYLALRPSGTLAETYNRQLEAEAFLHDIEQRDACPACRRAVTADFAVCPYCRATLQEPCASCRHTLQSAWTICPYCASERATQRPAAIRADVREQRPLVAQPAARNGAVQKRPVLELPISS